MSKRVLWVLVASLVAGPVAAKELAGVQMPDVQSVEGKDLKLNGPGLRKKLFFKVYVAGLYLETPSKDATGILSADGLRRVDMSMLRDLDRQTIVDAIRKGFEKNARAQLAQLKDRLDKF